MNVAEWREVLDAGVLGVLDEEQAYAARDAASFWGECAIGAHLDELRVADIQEARWNPSADSARDQVLIWKGLAFERAFDADNWTLARELFEEIGALADAEKDGAL